MSDAHDSWEKFLNPETLRGNLISVSLFITAYEMFKSGVVERLETFYMDGFNESGLIIDQKYKSDVLAKHKSPVYASLMWFQENGAIDDDDLKRFDEIRQHRNDVTHKIAEYITDAKRNLDVEKFKDLISLYEKIEKWWVINIELATDPDIDMEKIDIDHVQSGAILSIQLMLDVALGNEPEEGFYYRKFREFGQKK